MIHRQKQIKRASFSTINEAFLHSENPAFERIWGFLGEPSPIGDTDDGKDILTCFLSIH